jgi:hypothetical protein
MTDADASGMPQLGLEIAGYRLESVIGEGGIVAETGEAGAPLALRLELDPEGGGRVIAIEDGPTVRVVRGSDGWRVGSP